MGRGAFVLVLCLLLGVPALGAERLRLATTTSVENSGLLAHLLPAFEQASGMRVEVLPTGSGKALKLAENGDVDAVLSHAPRLEREYLERKAVVDAKPVMYNEFVLVGPPEDPAGVATTSGAPGALAEALRRIAQAKARFVSRGDDSGTYEQEKELWQRAGVRPVGSWYAETGQGMGATLRIAYERRAYTLSDSATFAQFAGRGDLQLLVRERPPLRNVYSVMATNPQRYPQVCFACARRWIEWLTSPAGQQRIASFRPGGEELFHPWYEGGPQPAACSPSAAEGCTP